MSTFRIICEYVIFMISAPGLATLNFRCSAAASRRAEQRKKRIMRIGQPELELFTNMWPKNAEYATVDEIWFYCSFTKTFFRSTEKWSWLVLGDLQTLSGDFGRPLDI